MSRGGEIRLPFGAEERTFRLGIGEWRKIQEKCDCGPPELLARLAPAFQALAAGARLGQIMAAGLLGRWRVDDVREPIYQGLIGGGDCTPTEAGELVRELVDERPFLEPLATAYQVVFASFSGVEDEPLGEREGETARRRSPEESSASVTSTAPPSRPASAPTRSTAGASGRSARSPTTPSAKAKARAPRRRPPKN